MSDHLMYAAFRFLEAKSPAIIRVSMTNMTTGKRASLAQICTADDPCPWAGAVTVEDVLQFSEDEVAILDACRKNPAITLERLVEVTGIERTRCSILHRNLKARNAC